MLTPLRVSSLECHQVSGTDRVVCLRRLIAERIRIGMKTAAATPDMQILDAALASRESRLAASQAVYAIPQNERLGARAWLKSIRFGPLRAWRALRCTFQGCRTAYSILRHSWCDGWNLTNK